MYVCFESIFFMCYIIYIYDSLIYNIIYLLNMEIDDFVISFYYLGYLIVYGYVIFYGYERYNILECINSVQEIYFE